MIGYFMELALCVVVGAGVIYGLLIFVHYYRVQRKQFEIEERRLNNKLDNDRDMR